MARSRGLGVLGAGLATATLLAALASGAIAATGAPASLKISVPATVRPGQHYTIKITGSYDKTAVPTVPYLLAFIQYTRAACKPTAKAEHALPTASWSWDFYPPTIGLLEPSPAFTRTDTWIAHSFTGTRHVCAYLYPKKVSLKNSATPIATTSARYRDV